MQTANVLVNLGGDSGTMVPKIATPAEIAVLIAIHGDEACKEIEPLPGEAVDDNGQPRTNRQELARLRMIYGNARDGENNRIIDGLFPGAGARVFETLDELGLPDQFYKAITRAKAPAPAAPAAPVTDLAEAKKSRKKAAAMTGETPVIVDNTETDGVKDMPDVAGEKLFA